MREGSSVCFLPSDTGTTGHVGGRLKLFTELLSHVQAEPFVPRVGCWWVFGGAVPEPCRMGRAHSPTAPSRRDAVLTGPQGC